MQFEKDMNSEHKKLFLMVRDELLKRDMTETKKERITTYSWNGGGVCHMRTMTHGIDVGFLKGAQFIDTYGRLTGNSKKMRVLSMSEFSRDLLGYYLDQAIAVLKR